jgi:hypothetical protein
MTVQDLANPHPRPGDGLRDAAANLLSARYGEPRTEARKAGKKVDIYFEYIDLKKRRRLFVEAKDYESPLTRAQVRDIWADYMGLIEKNRPAELIIVTRSGLTADADAYVSDELTYVSHLTIWELENTILGLSDYIRHLSGIFSEGGLSEYYVPARVSPVAYLEGKQQRKTLSKSFDVFDTIQDWIVGADSTPIAILGGYGAGKTSLARRIVAHQAVTALKDAGARRPILVKLGAFSRSASIDGIFGSMFSSEFPNNGFNFLQFLRANERGRLLIVLDGFDEMKHAMTWADFRYQAQEINKLIVDGARIVLLGRPSAFLSQDEHSHILRGKKRSGTVWRKIADWPEFREYDLQDFTPDERADFVRRYISRSQRDSSRYSRLEESDIEMRVSRVNALADLAKETFGKPVHAKILTDLGADPGFDLGRFGTGVTRWQLYEAFFETLVDRETEKSARKDISAKNRLEFIREIALWLWTAKGGSTSFQAGDLPVELMDRIPGGDSMEPEARVREYLTGSLLEKKSGDVFYFGHRSFAEFLVAQRIVSRPPSRSDHALYSMLFREGVEAFIIDGARADTLRGWAKTLSYADGTIRLEYLHMLAEKCGGLRKLRRELVSGSLWSDVLEQFGDKIDFGPVLESKLSKAVMRADNLFAAILIKIINYSMSKRTIDDRGVDHDTLIHLAASLLNKELGKPRDKYGLLKNKPGLVAPQLIFRSCVTRHGFSSKVSINGRRLVAQCDDILRGAGIDISFGDGSAVHGIPDMFTFAWNDAASKVGLFYKAKARARIQTLAVTRGKGVSKTVEQDESET